MGYENIPNQFFNINRIKERVENRAFERTKEKKNGRWRDKISKNENKVIPYDIKSNVQSKIVPDTHTATNKIKGESRNGPKIFERKTKSKKIDLNETYNATEDTENKKGLKELRPNNLICTKGECMESKSNNLKKIEKKEPDNSEDVRTTEVVGNNSNNLEMLKMSD